MGSGRGFSLRRFPSLDVREFPAGAARSQLNRLRKGRVGSQPATRGQVVDAVPRSNLTIRKVSFRHGRPHAIA
jgi:hypothetical protein